MMLNRQLCAQNLLADTYLSIKTKKERHIFSLIGRKSPRHDYYQPVDGNIQGDQERRDYILYLTM
jgi:hypothetical protein